ncbi:MAG: nucleoside-diphosphate sugar epimerase/dehydratase [Eubacteriales bacterium]|nr:nucleoside-diphosphate sugar epimerase/dehydratase [Eubacteriales bacterium]
MFFRIRTRTQRLLQMSLWMLGDAACVLLSAGIALALTGARWQQVFPVGLVLALADVAIFAGLGLYRSLWRFAGIRELVQITLGVTTAGVANVGIVVASSMMAGGAVSLRAVLAMLPILLILVGGMRLMPRIGWFVRMESSVNAATNRKRALVVGAGVAADVAIAQMQTRPDVGLAPCLVVDDAPQKLYSRIHGVPVAGTTADIPRLAKEYQIDQIIFAIPSASAEQRRRILEICAGTKCHTKILPTMEVLMHGVKIERLQDINPNDLLNRQEVLLDVASVRAYVQGQTVLVTGGGGSIGSELCRQLALFSPRKLVVFDIYENNAYELYMDLKRQYGDGLDVDVAIGSVRDMARLRQLFAQYRPAAVFHAAAHKHVPLMEDSPAEAVKNNVFGTLNTARAAQEYGVQRFVLISTDKAVNPANVMGATKHMAEMVIQYMNAISTTTQYVAVRFGNVLGSNGSVIPLFQRQILAGGPVTVTHRDITRYFMTIPEAARLVLQAGSMAREGQIFILDMGEPVRIDDFARKFIRLSGYEPDVEMPIVYTGLRPGEKMYEELLQDCEQMENTSFPGILVGCVADVPPDEILRRLEYLQKAVQEEPERTKEFLAQVVSTYRGA